MPNLIQPAIAEMLKAFEATLKKFNIDFYVVGAVARDIQLGEYITARKTNDVDIAIRVGNEKQYSVLKHALTDSGDFVAHTSEAIKLFYKGAIELDLLPFGDIEDDNREIKLHDPKLFIINMPGFKEVYPFAKEIEFENLGSLKICSLEGLVFLKLMAYGDNPSRTKDIADIDHILINFFDINETAVYNDHYDLMERYPTENRDYLHLVGAHAIGRQLRKFILKDKSLHDRITKTLQKRPTSLWQAILDGMND
ncbi:hypothetical protein ACPPVU_12785 [Mucilaginibacter sp. McL0603]|uniref:hypothetical protein n=1 Tax=Mucilaginibacter sp. McL0603 TaxID=3415670 RepID=UPI003CEBF887